MSGKKPSPVSPTEPAFTDAAKTPRLLRYRSEAGSGSTGCVLDRGLEARERDEEEDDAGEDDRRLHFLLHDDGTQRALLRENETKARQLTKLRADPWRFAVAPIFAFLSISNAMQWIAFSPIVNEVRLFFHMNATQVNFLASTYVIAYVAIVFLSCKLYEVTGIKNGVLVSAVMNAVGALVKIIALYAWPHAPLLYVAQVFNSFTEVLTIATPPLIANRWFPENERMVANTIMSSALNFGCGIGVLIPTFFITPEKQDKKHFGHFFWFNFAICFSALGLVIFLFPRKPRYAASFAADRQQSREEERLRAVREAFHFANNNSNSGSSRHHTDEDPTSGSGSVTGEPGVEPASGGAAHTLADTVDDGARSDSGAQGKRCRQRSTNEHATSDGRKQAKKRRSGSASRKETPDALVTIDETAATATAASPDREVEPVNVFSVLIDCVRQMRYNYSFSLLMFGAAAELGLIWAVATVLPQMLMPYGISEAISAWIGFLNLVLGTVVCPFMMPLVERFGRRYKFLLCTLAVVLMVNMTLLTLLLHFGPRNADGTVEADSTYYVIVTFVCWGGVSGLCQNFMMPLMFEYVVELTFPMAESTSAPALTWAACLTNFLLTLAFGELLTNTPDEAKALRVFIGATVVTAIGAIALFLTKPMQKRRDYEQTRREEQARLAEEIEELRRTIAGIGPAPGQESGQPRRDDDVASAAGPTQKGGAITKVGRG